MEEIGQGERGRLGDDVCAHKELFSERGCTGGTEDAPVPLSAAARGWVLAALMVRGMELRVL